MVQYGSRWQCCFRSDPAMMWAQMTPIWRYRDNQYFGGPHSTSNTADKNPTAGLRHLHCRPDMVARSSPAGCKIDSSTFHRHWLGDFHGGTGLGRLFDHRLSAGAHDGKPDADNGHQRTGHDGSLPVVPKSNVFWSHRGSHWVGDHARLLHAVHSDPIVPEASRKFSLSFLS